MVECAAAEGALLTRERGVALGAAVDEHVRVCARCSVTRARLQALDFALTEEEVVRPPPFEAIEGAARTAARARRQMQRVRRALPLTLAVAGAVAVTVVASQALHRPGPALRLAVAGDALDAARGVREVVLADGARVMVPAGRAIVVASDRAHTIVRLETGTAFVSVPHMGPDRSFVVLTDELEARVHGTRFDVRRVGQGTLVSVTEGTVEVRPRDQPAAVFMLGKGESKLIESVAQRRAQARAAARASLDGRDDVAAEEQLRAWLATNPPADEAAEAYALLGWQLSRHGDRAGALGNYRRALELLPAERTPLWADNACARLALLEESEGMDARATAWRRCLERFPDGVHSSTARSRLGSAGDARKAPR